MDNDFKANLQISWSGINIHADFAQICGSVLGKNEEDPEKSASDEQGN